MHGVGAEVTISTILGDNDGLLDVCTGARLSRRVLVGAGEVVGLLPHTFDTTAGGLLSHALATVADVLFAEDSFSRLEDLVFKAFDEDALLATTTSTVVSQSTSSCMMVSSETPTVFSDLLMAELVVFTVFSLLLIDVVVEPVLTPPDGIQTLLLAHALLPPRRRVRPSVFPALAEDDTSTPA